MFNSLIVIIVLAFLFDYINGFHDAAYSIAIIVSTTHTITGSIIGVGAAKRLRMVRWGVTVNLRWAWILAIPVSAVLAAGVY